MNIQRPTPDTDAAFRDGYTFCREDMRPAVEFCANLERERDEALESKDRISKRAEAIRCELVEKDKQLESLRKKLIESEVYQAGLVADIEAMREAIKEAYEALMLAPYRDQEALAKLQPFLKP